MSWGLSGNPPPAQGAPKPTADLGWKGSLRRHHCVHVPCLTPPGFVLTPPGATALPVPPYRTLLDPRGLTQCHRTHICLLAVFLFKLLILWTVTNSEVFSLLPLSTLPNSSGGRNSFVHDFPCRFLCLAFSALQLFCSPHVTSTALSQAFPSCCFEVLINPINQLSYIHSLLLKN